MPDESPTDAKTLQQENADLRAKLKQIEEERRATAKVAKRAGIFWIFGSKLENRFDEFLAARSPRGIASSPERELAATIIYRIVRVGAWGMAVAWLPMTVLIWQNFLIRGQNVAMRTQNVAIREQIDRQAADADLSYSELHRVFLKDALLTGANVSGADLRGTRGLTQKQISGTLGSDSTKLPRRLRKPQHWSMSSAKQKPYLTAPLPQRIRVRQWPRPGRESP